MRRKKLSGDDVAKILLEYGYQQYHYKGSHLVMVKDGNYVHIPMKEILTCGTLKNICKRTGVVIA